jgi:hypothetical protein
MKPSLLACCVFVCNIFSINAFLSFAPNTPHRAFRSNKFTSQSLLMMQENNHPSSMEKSLVPFPIRRIYTDTDSITKQRDNLNNIQIHRELVYRTIKKKIRASSYDFGTQNINHFFARFDIDRDGCLDFSEFQNVVRQLGIHPGKLSQEEVRIIWQEMNSEGNVNVHSFLQWLDARTVVRSDLQSSEQTAWTYGESAGPSLRSGEDKFLRAANSLESCVPLNSSSFINSIVGGCEDRVSEVSYFLMTEIGISQEKLISIALKAPEIYHLDVKASLKPLLDDMLDLGVQTQKVAKMIHLFPALLSISHEKRRDVICCLGDFGLSPNLIGKCLHTHPQLLSLNVQDKIIPTAHYLVSEAGISKSGLCKIVSTLPSVLGLSVSNNLRPKFDFFRDELRLSKAKVAALVMKFPQVLCLSLSNNIRPTIQFLTDELGIASSDTGKIVHQNPQLLGLNVAVNLRGKVAYLVEELGVPREQLGRIISAFPTLLSLSHETNLRPKVSFLTDVAGFSMSEIVRAPHLLAYSLEQRIKPRCAVMIKSGARMALSSLLSPSDAVFNSRFGAAS